MDKFIRLDEIGTWKGENHISSFTGYDGSYNEELDAENENLYGYLENGISCYSLDTESLEDITLAIENLYSYWVIDIARFQDAIDYENMQVTIFEGNKINAYGHDGEDLAICTATLKKIDAVEFMTKLFQAKEQFEAFENEYDWLVQITKDQYNQILLDLISL